MKMKDVETSFRRKVTMLCLEVLFSMHGIPVQHREKRYFWRTCYVFRISFLVFANFYVLYRLYKLVQQMNVMFDIFPMINACVSAGIADSIAIYSSNFSKFSKRLYRLLENVHIQLSAGTLCKLAMTFILFMSYIVVCTTIFPMYAKDWFDAASNNETEPDFFHTNEQMKHISHNLIFLVCSVNVVSNAMLYCFVCSVLQHILTTICEDIRHSDPETLLNYRSEFIGAAEVVKITDNVFSLFGMVGLGCVFARACSCIHFYLNLRDTVRSSLLFLLVQIAFDFCALTAMCCFAARVSEEGRKIAPGIFHVSQRVSPCSTSYHLECLDFCKIVMSSDVHLSAWKLFPFTRKVVPTVIGATVSYVAVIIQMHVAAASSPLFLPNTPNNHTTDIG